MNVERYEPIALFNEFQTEFNRLFPEVFSVRRNKQSREQWAPQIDIKDDEDHYIVLADIPGVDPNQIDISLENRVLTLKGEKKAEQIEEKSNYRYRERQVGSFYRQFTLPSSVDSENIKAAYQHGVLSITIPKQKNEAKNIAIKIADNENS